MSGMEDELPPAVLRQVTLRAPEGLLVNVLHCRWLLEPQVAALAAQRGDGGNMDMIRALACPSTKHPSCARVLDISFHLAIAMATHNRVLNGLIGALLDAIPTEVHMLLQGFAQDRDHERILRAIERRQHAEAHRAMQSHLGLIREAAEEIEACWRAGR